MEDVQKSKEFRNGSKVFHELYTEERIQSIKRMIETQQKQGKHKRFSISVDGEMVISHTTDLELFDRYQDFIEPHTEKVEIRLYFGASPNANRYLFHLKEKPFGGFGQVEKPAHVNDIVADALERQSIETELETLRRKYKKLKKKYRLAESELSEKQTDIKDIVAQGMQLYGVFNASKNIQDAQIQGLSPVSEVQIEKEQSKADEFYEELKNQVGEEKLIAALKTWGVFAAHPQLRSEFEQIVKQKTMQHGKAHI